MSRQLYFEARMRLTKKIVVCFVTAAFIAQAQGNTFNRVRYNGGSVDSKVDPKEWDNRLTITSDLITLALKDGKTVTIPTKTVISLSYGQEAHRRVGTMIALAILVAPVALFGLLHKTRLHYIGIQYSVSDNKTAGILLQGDKDNYRAILVGLQGVTGVPVAVAEKDREFLPVGVKTDIAKNSEEENQPQAQSAEAKPIGTLPAVASGGVNVASNPAGGDVLVDGDFVGNCPASLKLAPGKHTVTVKSSGYKDWSREITVQPGSDVQLTATLEK
jgi:PEGA domain